MFTSIKGLSRGLAVMGYIKIGKKGELRKSVNNAEFRQPKKLDHFEIVSREVDSASDNFKTDTEMMKVLGDKPTELQIMLQYDQIELNFPHYLAAYKGPKLFCRGNGETAVRDSKEISCDPLTCPIYQKKHADEKIQCKPQGKLYAILPEKNMIGGVYAFKTTSWESIRNIISSLELISSLTGGILAGLMLKLKLIPTRDQTPTGTTVNYKVAVVYQGKPQQLRMLAVDERNLRAVSTIDRKAIEEARRQDLVNDTTLQEEAAETVAEYYPLAAGIEPSDKGGEEALSPKKEEPGLIHVSTAKSATPAAPAPVAPPSFEPPVVKQPGVPAAPENPNQIHLSGDVDMDIQGLFTKLNFSRARQKGQLDFNKDKKPTLLKNLIDQARAKGFEVIEQAAKAE